MNVATQPSMKKLHLPLFISIISALFFGSCYIQRDLSPSSSSSNFQNWEEIDNINLEYDMDAYDTTQRLNTNDEGYVIISEFFDEYLSNAYQVKISQEVYLDRNNEHKLIVSRRWAGKSSVQYYIYKLQIIYRNCTIIYEFINDNRNGAMWDGDELGFIGYYKDEHISKFKQDVESVMRIIYNRLSKSDDPMTIGQAQAIKYCLDNYRSTYFF